MSTIPVTFIDAGGIPVTLVEIGGIPSTAVASGGLPVTVAAVNGLPIAMDSAPLSSIFSRPGQTFGIGAWRWADTAAVFRDWLEAPVDFFDKHADRSSWSGMISSIADFGADNAAAPEATIWSIPLVASLSGGRDDVAMAAAAAGSYDGHYTDLAEAVLAADNRSGAILVRSGWEQNGDWQPWAAQNEEDGDEFVAAWVRFVACFRAVSSRFKFIWCPNILQSDPDFSWPGAAYVDVISFDAYYNAAENAGDGPGWFNYVKTANYGLDWYTAKSAAEGIPLAVSEWGVKASQNPNVGMDGDEPNTATETSSQAALVSLMVGWFAENNVILATYWDSNAAIDTLLSNDQYPLTGARFLATHGYPAITSAATADLNGNGTTPLEFPIVTPMPCTFTLSSNADGFAIDGANLTLPAQTWADGGDNTRTVTITATDARGLTGTQDFTLTVVEPITDLYPDYYLAFDPVGGFFKLGSEITTDEAEFLALAGVSFASDPAAAISGAGYHPTSAHHLAVSLPDDDEWSLYVETEKCAHTADTYHGMAELRSAGDPTTSAFINRNPYAGSPNYNVRSNVRAGAVTVGSDTDLRAQAASGTFVVGITVSGSAIKFFASGALRATATTGMATTTPLNSLNIGWANFGAPAWWDGNIHKLLLKRATDSDATAAAMT